MARLEGAGGQDASWRASPARTLAQGSRRPEHVSRASPARTRARGRRWPGRRLEGTVDQDAGSRKPGKRTAPCRTRRHATSRTRSSRSKWQERRKGACGELPASDSAGAVRPERARWCAAELKPAGEGPMRARAAGARTRRDKMQMAARLEEAGGAGVGAKRASVCRSKAAAAGCALERSERAARWPREENTAQARPRSTRGAARGRATRSSTRAGDEGQCAPAGWEELGRGRRSRAWRRARRRRRPTWPSYRLLAKNLVDETAAVLGFPGDVVIYGADVRGHGSAE
jgi:hypothetical protein